MFELVALLSAIIFVLLDSFYLNLIKNYLSSQIQSVQGSKIKLNYVGVLLCYVFLIIGLNYFIIKPNKSVQDAFLFGLVVYGVYETTNYAVFDKWSLFTVFIDTLWGGILFALTTYLVQVFRKML
jgi:uncharacterized membrane protein